MHIIIQSAFLQMSSFSKYFSLKQEKNLAKFDKVYAPPPPPPSQHMEHLICNC